MIGSRFSRSFLALVGLCSSVASASHDRTTAVRAPAYSECQKNHLDGANSAELKEAIAKAAGARVAAGSLDRFFTENLVIVAPAYLRDGQRDFIAYVSGGQICGSGGCNAYVLKQQDRAGTEGSSFELVTEIVPARVPISVLPVMHNGWHDIGVKVAGGGNRFIPGYVGALAYDGSAYQSNPTLDDVREVDDGSGRIILGPPGAAPGQCRLR